MGHYDDILEREPDRRNHVRKLVTEELTNKISKMSLEEKVDFLIGEYIKEKAEEQVRIRCDMFHR